jgi:hypothetical protein
LVGRFAGVGADVGLPCAFTEAVGDGAAVGPAVCVATAVGETADVVAGWTRATLTTALGVGPRVVEPVGLGLGREEPTVAGAAGSRTGEPTTARRGAGGSGRKGE